MFSCPLCLGLLACCCPAWATSMVCCTLKHLPSNFNMARNINKSFDIIIVCEHKFHLLHDSSTKRITTMTFCSYVRLLPIGLKSQIGVDTIVKCSTMMYLRSMTYYLNFKVSVRNLVANVKS